MATTTEASRNEEAGTGTLLVEAARDFQTLLEQEWKMAKTEMRLEYGQLKRAAEKSALGLGLAIVAGLMLALSAARGLAETGLALWASYLIVGAVIGLIAFVLFKSASHEAEDANMVPDRTVKTLTEGR